ncbi:MAG TPA: CoA ester lyase [Acidimicrobiales bacterium]|nr:CoA ester lyase [Acidimicrobiales bacterium]
MKPYRSLLFVPANDEARAREGAAAGADALILDLEDLVVPAAKPKARPFAAQLISRLRAENPGLGLFVRINPLESRQTWLDLEHVVVPELDGLFLSKIYTLDDIKRLDALTTEWEARNGVREGQIEYLVPGETAECIEHAFEISKGPRVATMIGASTSGDIAHALGYQWTREGVESLYYQSRILLANRAAGKKHPIGGCWEAADDIEGLIADARFHRQLGFRGALITHPSHARHVNEVYTPSAAEVARYRELIRRYEEAERDGRGDFVFEGKFTDVAHVKTAREWLALADAIATLERPPAVDA